MSSRGGVWRLQGKGELWTKFEKGWGEGNIGALYKIGRV